MLNVVSNNHLYNNVYKVYHPLLYNRLLNKTWLIYGMSRKSHI